MIEIIFTILLNALPILLLIVPIFFIWKKYVGKIYYRIFLGIVVFYFIYWILPIIFQLGETPDHLDFEGNSDYSLGSRFLAAHIGSLIALFTFYPLVTLPFIFFVAPFISILFVCNRLRKEKGSIKENLKNLTFEYNESPYHKIKNEIIKNDWSREKEILKLMIVLLPVSLYLLQVIIDLSDLQNLSLTRGETALGWFIEILFVYLAIFIFSIELLYSSKIALKGKYFGETIRAQTYRSLYSVGAPISILSIILFSVQYTESIPVIIFFFAYFIMASIIFVLFLKIFEPISLLIFIKIINWWKNKGTKKNNLNLSNWYWSIIYGSLVLFIYSVINIPSVLLFNLFSEDQSTILNSAEFSSDPSLQNAVRFDLLIIFTTVVLIILPLLLSAFFLALCLKKVKNQMIGFILFLSVIIGFSIVMILLGANPIISFMPDEYWLTGKLSSTNAFGFTFYTLRTAAFSADLFIEGEITLLGIIAIPYLYTRYIFNIIIWALLILYYKKDFNIKNVEIDEKYKEKNVFSSMKMFFTFDEYFLENTQYLISKNKNISSEKIEKEKPEVKDVWQKLDSDKLLKEIKPSNEDDIKKFYFILKYLFSNNLIRIWQREFSYIYEQAEKQGLYIIYSDGRGIFDYEFIKGELQDASLISGMFSAISSFIKETTKSAELLKTIDHGDITILIEYGQYCFGALFIKGTQTVEVRDKLKLLIKKFEDKHRDVIIKWNGILKPFSEVHLLVDEIFKEE